MAENAPASGGQDQSPVTDIFKIRLKSFPRNQSDDGNATPEAPQRNATRPLSRAFRS